ncbi:hypothetical protein [Aliiroseovarius subalbicans]|uniref:hypothetical protein n=1 Tax=Aliiroseovarius subalbicans TaxID=2925840 RepID=UPI001F580E93|nr:hypothetical protein [Aliiroseovarius subalbicans]MCI2397848.1 hypothetical protein [Aliiroseovarius subalbicans]
MPNDHPLFRDHPTTGSVTVSTGAEPVPYRAEDGEGLMLIGRGNLETVTQAMGSEGVHPVVTASGHAAMGIILSDFRKASHGAHREIQVFALCSKTPGEVIGDDAMALPVAMTTRSDLGTLCLHLWNDTARVVAFNTEYLGLNARLAACEFFPRDGDAVTFACADKETGPILRGQIGFQKRPSLATLWEVLRIAGWRAFVHLGRSPYAGAFVVNKRSDVLPENRFAPTFTGADKMVTRHWNDGRDDGRDRLELLHPDLQPYGFEPIAVEHMWPFRFVYHHPDHKGG